MRIMYGDKKCKTRPHSAPLSCLEKTSYTRKLFIWRKGEKYKVSYSNKN